MKDKKLAYNRIKAALAERDKTSLWLSQALKKNKATVSKWCTNETQPTIETLFQIAEVLNVDARTLLVQNQIKADA